MFTPSLPTSPLPGRADSQGSEETSSTSSYFSSVSHHTKNSIVHTVEPRKVGGGDRRPSHNRLSSSDSFCFLKDDESQDSTAGNDDSGVMATMLNYLNLTSLFRGPSPNDERSMEHNYLSKTQLLTPQEEHKSPQKVPLSMSRSFTYGTRGGGHSKMLSWHGHTDHEWEKEQFIKSIRTPITLAPVHLRVQDYDLKRLNSTWDIHEYNDIFVHPLSLPELFQASKGRESYLVMVSVQAPSTTKSRPNDGRQSESVSVIHSNVPTPNSRHATSHLPENPKRDEEGVLNILNRLTEFKATPPAITVSSPSPTHTNPESFRTADVVCHMRFATAVKFSNKRKRSSTLTLEEIASVSREGSASPIPGQSSPFRSGKLTGYLPILPNHIVMSDLIRQQLGIRAGSLVKLTGCQDNWQVNCRQSRVFLYLHPIIKKVSSHIPCRVQW